MRFSTLQVAAGIVLALALVPAHAAPAGAQAAADWDAAREQVTRAELHDLMERLQAQASSSAYSARLRGEAERSIEVIQRRLEEGDFRVGDRVVLEVENEPALSDTLVVRPGPMVDVPVLGQLPLGGVLRSELGAHVESHLKQYIRNPTVRTEALIRVSVLGAVGQPGFYTISTHLPITDALMMAGGPAGNALLTDLRIERGNTRIWEGTSMETAVIQGRTLDQMNIQAGDRIVVPQTDTSDWWSRGRVITTVIGGALSIGFALARLF